MNLFSGLNLGVDVKTYGDVHSIKLDTFVSL